MPYSLCIRDAGLASGHEGIVSDSADEQPPIALRLVRRCSRNGSSLLPSSHSHSVQDRSLYSGSRK